MYQTLNGLVMYLLDKIPQVADVIEVSGWRLEIVDIDGKRIDKILAIRLATDETDIDRDDMSG